MITTKPIESKPLVHSNQQAQEPSLRLKWLPCLALYHSLPSFARRHTMMLHSPLLRPASVCLLGLLWSGSHPEATASFSRNDKAVVTTAAGSTPPRTLLTPEGMWARVGRLIDDSPEASTLFHSAASNNNKNKNNNEGGTTPHRHAQLRALQTDAGGGGDSGSDSGVTFDQVCGLIEQVLGGGSELGNATQAWINCTCDSSTNTLSCYTPQYICPNITDVVVADMEDDELPDSGLDVCASILFEVSFLEDLSGINNLKVCVDYEGAKDPAGPFRDGCVSATMKSDGTTIDTCKGEFDDASGTLTTCNSCGACSGSGSGSGDGSQSGGIGFQLDCSNIYPNATTNGCFGLDGSAEEKTFLFPAAENGGTGSGTATDGGNGGGTTNNTNGGGTTNNNNNGGGTANGSQNTSAAAGLSSVFGLVAAMTVLVGAGW